jgi:hypothetical protein
MGELVSVGKGVKVAVAVRVGRSVTLAVASPPEGTNTFAWADFGKKMAANAIKHKKAGITIFCRDVQIFVFEVDWIDGKKDVFLNLSMVIPLF